MSENSPVTFAHKVFWGEHKLLQFPTENGQGVINVWSLQWSMWVDQDKTAPALIQKSSGSGITIVDLGTGTCQVTLNADDWDEITPGNSYYYELWRVDVGFEQCLAFGEFYVR